MVTGAALRKIAENGKDDQASKPVKLPRSTRVMDAIGVLKPAEREFVRLYTDPTGPAFSNASEAARRAGFSADSGWALSKRAVIMEAVQAIAEEREQAGKQVERFIGGYTLDAAKELVRQLGAGTELRLMDPTEHLEISPGKTLQRGDSAKLKEINNHNRNVLSAMRERREAAKLLVAYEIGTPEQRLKVTNEKALPDVVDLTAMSDEELRGLGQMLQNLQDLREKQAAAADDPENAIVIEKGDGKDGEEER
jgi:hypothetical protein